MIDKLMEMLQAIYEVTIFTELMYKIWPTIRSKDVLIELLKAIDMLSNLNHNNVNVKPLKQSRQLLRKLQFIPKIQVNIPSVKSNAPPEHFFQ